VFWEYEPGAKQHMSQTETQRSAQANSGEERHPSPEPTPTVEARPEELATPQHRSRHLLRRFLRSSAGFWSGEARAVAWRLTLALLGVIVLLIGAAYAMNVWNRLLFDALQQRDGALVARLAGFYAAILALSVGLSVGQVYLRTTLQRRWRAWVTDHLVDRWLSNGRYYQLNLIKGDHANPEARIADDVRIATESPVDFVSGVLQAFLSAATFIVVLWNIGGSLDLGFAGIPVVVPGFLVVAAVLYALIASGAMVMIGRRFVMASETKNQVEAEHRYAITRVRENGESIALIRGEEEERAGLRRALGRVLGAWRNITLQWMKTTVVSQTSSYIAPILPVLLCAPKFLDGSMSLGEVMQAASAFTIVQSAFNWLVDNYPRLADWTASARRVASLIVSLDVLEKAEQGDQVGRIGITPGAGQGPALRLKDLAVTLDDGTVILDETEVDIMPGERVLIVGESGTGKSTLVRALAGLWPWGGGSIEVREGARLFLLPQRPYVPIGTLQRAATYPDAADSRPREEVATAFEQVGLGHVVERLDEDAPWDQILSGGEKQRLAFARILLHKPDIVVLDEATSALDPGSQDAMMELLIARFPETTVVSVGHRPELEVYHSRKVTLGRQEGGARIIGDQELPSQPGRRLGRWIRGMVGARQERA
jgi:putative ATP-binding cassette transporter